jgi:hypothetical protein
MMIDPGEVQDLLGRWWWNYDEGNFHVLRGLLTNDTHFRCRTDTGATDYEEFVRANLHGRDEVMEWQQEHRTNSPYPLRHNGTNVHVVDQRGTEASFASYIHVTHLVAGQVTNLSSAIVNGLVRREADLLRLADLEVVLDTMDSVVFALRAKETHD